MKTVFEKIMIFILLASVFLVFYVSFMSSLILIKYEMICKKNVEIFEEFFNEIPGVEIIDIHGDIDCDNIMVRLKIADKGEIMFGNILNDCANFPEDIYVSEINGFSFSVCDDSCRNSVSLNIGMNGLIMRKLGLTIETFDDIVGNFDSIAKFVEGLKHFPEWNHISDGDESMRVMRKTYFPFKEHRGALYKCIDPLLYINGCESKEDYLNKLEWKY